MIVCYPRSVLIFISLFFFNSCYKKQIEITKIHIDRKSLASSFTNTPDPRQKIPPLGEQLLINLSLDPEIDLSSCRAVLYLVFKSLETQEIEFIPTKHQDVISYFILGEQFQGSKGFLTYKLEVYENNKQLALYHHPMWLAVLKNSQTKL
jgi:hypothetical protein